MGDMELKDAAKMDKKSGEELDDGKMKDSGESGGMQKGKTTKKKSRNLAAGGPNKMQGKLIETNGHGRSGGAEADDAEEVKKTKDKDKGTKRMQKQLAGKKRKRRESDVENDGDENLTRSIRSRLEEAENEELEDGINAHGVRHADYEMIDLTTTAATAGANVDSVQKYDVEVAIFRDRARLGFGVVRIIDGVLHAVFGEINKRPLDHPSVTKILRSYIENGILYHAHPMPAIIPPSFVDSAELTSTAIDALTKPPIKFTPTALACGKIRLLGGAHRYEALLLRIEQIKKRVAYAQSKLEAASRSGNKDNIARWQAQCQLEERDLNNASLWVLEFFDEDKVNTFPNPYHVKSSISSNKVHFQYKETRQESLFSHLYKINAAQDDETRGHCVEHLHTMKGRGPFGSLLQCPEVLDTLLHSTRFPGLRFGQILDPAWLKGNIMGTSIGGIVLNVFGQQRAMMMDICTPFWVDESQTLQRGSPVYEIWSDKLIQAIDQSYIVYWKPVLGADGSRTPEQIKQWSLYVADILRIMAGAFGTGTEVSRKSTQVGQAAACMYENTKNLLSVDLEADDTTCPLPLCTPTAMLNIYTMWSEVNDAVTEIVPFVESLWGSSIVQKLNGPSAYHDGSMMLFRAISRRTPGDEINKHHIVTNVVNFLRSIRTTCLSRIQLDVKQWPAIPKCTGTQGLADSDLRVQKLFKAMEESWKEQHKANQPRAQLSEAQLNLGIEYRCAMGSEYHWGDRAATNRKKDLLKAAKAAIGQCERLVSHWEHSLTSSCLWDILEQFAVIAPNSVWPNLERADFDVPEHARSCANAKSSMESNRQWSEHRKAANAIFGKIGNLPFAQSDGSKLHWKLQKALLNVNEIFVELSSECIWKTSHPDEPWPGVQGSESWDLGLSFASDPANQIGVQKSMNQNTSGETTSGINTPNLPPSTPNADTYQRISPPVMLSQPPITPSSDGGRSTTRSPYSYLPNALGPAGYALPRPSPHINSPSTTGRTSEKCDPAGKAGNTHTDMADDSQLPYAYDGDDGYMPSPPPPEKPINSSPGPSPYSRSSDLAGKARNTRTDMAPLSSIPRFSGLDSPASAKVGINSVLTNTIRRSTSTTTPPTAPDATGHDNNDGYTLSPPPPEQPICPSPGLLSYSGSTHTSSTIDNTSDQPGSMDSNPAGEAGYTHTDMAGNSQSPYASDVYAATVSTLTFRAFDSPGRAKVDINGGLANKPSRSTPITSPPTALGGTGYDCNGRYTLSPPPHEQPESPSLQPPPQYRSKSISLPKSTIRSSSIRLSPDVVPASLSPIKMEPTETELLPPTGSGPKSQPLPRIGQYNYQCDVLRARHQNTDAIGYGRCSMAVLAVATIYVAETLDVLHPYSDAIHQYTLAFQREFGRKPQEALPLTPDAYLAFRCPKLIGRIIAQLAQWEIFLRTFGRRNGFLSTEELTSHIGNYVHSLNHEGHAREILRHHPVSDQLSQSPYPFDLEYSRRLHQQYLSLDLPTAVPQRQIRTPSTAAATPDIFVQGSSKMSLNGSTTRPRPRPRPRPHIKTTQPARPLAPYQVDDDMFSLAGRRTSANMRVPRAADVGTSAAGRSPSHQVSSFKTPSTGGKVSRNTKKFRQLHQKDLENLLRDEEDFYGIEKHIAGPENDFS